MAWVATSRPVVDEFPSSTGMNFCSEPQFVSGLGVSALNGSLGRSGL
jgi:hypothetical protein